MLRKLLLLALIATSATAADPRFSTGKRNFKKAHVTFYVQTVTLKPPSAAFDRVLREREDAEIADTLKSAKEYPGGDYEMRLAAEMKLCNDRYASLLLEEEEDFKGAHPGHSTSSILFDRRAQRALSLGDLFRPGAPYLQTIAAICQKELHAKGFAKDLMWADGATGKPKNYKTFYLTPTKLVIWFDFYQVCSYAEGPQEVAIPLTSLRSILR